MLKKEISNISDILLKSKHDQKKILLEIAEKAIAEMNAGQLLRKVLKKKQFSQKLILIAIGKAAWQMAETAIEILETEVIKGYVITKYGHSSGEIDKCRIFQAGHPLPDENSLLATETILNDIAELSSDFEILFLISGGGSALFEKPLPGISLTDLQSINRQLICSGATINEINTVRKHLSSVKGGRFAELFNTHRINTFYLSDVIGDDIDIIASGPCCSDPSTSQQAIKIIEKYQISITPEILLSLQQETPKKITNSKFALIGNIDSLCKKAQKIATDKGFRAEIIKTDFIESTQVLCSELMKEIETYASDVVPSNPIILILGGEPVIRVEGKGKGGRNTHLALLISQKIADKEGITFLSIASDGTDGSTDAAGAIVDCSSWQRLNDAKQNAEQFLRDYDSYNAHKIFGDLIFSGPTGTNVNDLIMILINKKEEK
jgi:hydroxypyruvate reductase